jgi:integrase/recombinase XerD
LQTKTEPYRGTGPSRLPVVLSAAEREALLTAPNQKAPTGLRNYCMLLLYLNLGLRASEAINLEVDSIDWQGGKVLVDGKGGKERVLWLSDSDLAALKRWRAVKPAGRYLFCTLAGGKICDRYVRDFVKRYARKKGITAKDVHPHTLRHTFATDLLKENNNIRLVQKALGHTSINTTMIYTHIVDEELENALKTLRS